MTTAIANGTGRLHWKAYQAEEVKRATMTLDQRLAYAREVDPNAAKRECSHCHKYGVTCADTARSDFSKHSGEKGKSNGGYALECKTCHRAYKAKHRENVKNGRVGMRKSPTVAKSNPMAKNGNNTAKTAAAMVIVDDTPATTMEQITAVVPIEASAPPVDAGLVWAGSAFAYERANVVRYEIDDEAQIVNVVTTALDIDRGVWKRCAFTHVDGEARAILAQLGGKPRVAGLSDEIVKHKAEIARLQAHNEALNQAVTELRQQVNGVLEVANGADEALNKAEARATTAESTLAALQARLAAAGITITIDK